MIFSLTFVANNYHECATCRQLSPLTTLYMHRRNTVIEIFQGDKETSSPEDDNKADNESSHSIGVRVTPGIILLLPIEK
jgi:hypothetical protein